MKSEATKPKQPMYPPQLWGVWHTEHGLWLITLAHGDGIVAYPTEARAQANCSEGCVPRRLGYGLSLANLPSDLDLEKMRDMRTNFQKDGHGNHVDLCMELMIDEITRLSAVVAHLRDYNAAAPDLLAACEEWVRYMDALDADAEPGDPLAEARRMYHRDRIGRMRAAIAKATTPEASR